MRRTWTELLACGVEMYYIFIQDAEWKIEVERKGESWRVMESKTLWYREQLE